MNRILQRNNTSQTWDATTVNIHDEQPQSGQKRSCTHFFEFENVPNTKSCTLPFTDMAVKTAALHTPTTYSNRKNGSSPSSNSQWQKFELSPVNSDESLDYITN